MTVPGEVRKPSDDHARGDEPDDVSARGQVEQAAGALVGEDRQAGDAEYEVEAERHTSSGRAQRRADQEHREGLHRDRDGEHRDDELGTEDDEAGAGEHEHDVGDDAAGEHAVDKDKGTRRGGEGSHGVRLTGWPSAAIVAAPQHSAQFLRTFTVLAVHDLEIRVGARLLMENVSFRVDKGDKIGLVGRNGAGKTTLTKTLAGEGQPLRRQDRPHAARSATCRRTRARAIPKSTARTRILDARGLGDHRARHAAGDPRDGIDG